MLGNRYAGRMNCITCTSMKDLDSPTKVTRKFPKANRVQAAILISKTVRLRTSVWHFIDCH